MEELQYCMKYVAKEGDDDFTTIRMQKRVRRKLGMLINNNTNLDDGLEQILDKYIEKLPEP